MIPTESNWVELIQRLSKWFEFSKLKRVKMIQIVFFFQIYDPKSSKWIKFKMGQIYRLGSYWVKSSQIESNWVKTESKYVKSSQKESNWFKLSQTESKDVKLSQNESNWVKLIQNMSNRVKTSQKRLKLSQIESTCF